MSRKFRPTILLILEEYSPLILMAFCLCIIMLYAENISENFRNGWKISGLYSAVFNWSAVQTGFSFGVYGFIAGRNDGFIEKVRNTKAMERFISYIKRANLVGFALTIASIPMTIIEPKLDIPFSLSYFLVSVWFLVFIWSFAAFLRLAYNFGIIVSVKSNKDIPA